jgi:hypothetical protein
MIRTGNLRLYPDTIERTNQQGTLTLRLKSSQESFFGSYLYDRIVPGIIANPDNEEYEETKTWLGNHFNPTIFSLRKVNIRLKPVSISLPKPL